MKVIVKELRTRGVRKGERELSHAAGVAGCLTLSNVGKYSQLKVHAETDSSHMVPLLPILYDAYCVSIQGRAMIWRGYQRAGEAATDSTYLQEWSIHVQDRV